MAVVPRISNTPAQMFTNELNGVKGFFPGQAWVVDKALPLASGETAANALAGRVVHINSSGEFELGGGAPTVATAPMTFLLFNSNDDFDVVGDLGNLVGAQPTTGSGGTGTGEYASVLTGVCTAQAAEVESTEFDTGDTFTPGACLVGADTTGIINTEATVTASAPLTIIGTVSSEGEFTNDHGVGVVRFYTMFHPIFEDYTP